MYQAIQFGLAAMNVPGIVMGLTHSNLPVAALSMGAFTVCFILGLKG